MSLENLSNIATIVGALGILLGALIVYFGKIILKAKKELTKDWVSEILLGCIFFALIIIAGVIVFIIPKLILEISSMEQKTINILIRYLIFLAIFSLQALIFKHLYKRVENTAKFKICKDINKEIVLFSALTIAITSLFFYIKNYLFAIPSIIFTYLIMTYLASIYGVESKESNHNRLIKIRLINKKSIIAKIKRLGDEFIDILPKGKDDEGKNRITLNKSQIFSIEYLEDKQNKK